MPYIPHCRCVIRQVIDMIVHDPSNIDVAFWEIIIAHTT